MNADYSIEHGSFNEGDFVSNAGVASDLFIEMIEGGCSKHFRRAQLASAIRESLQFKVPVILNAPRGSGVTTLLKRISRATVKSGGFHKYISLRGMSQMDITDLLDTVFLDLLLYKSSCLEDQESGNTFDCYLAVDDVPGFDMQSYPAFIAGIDKIRDLGCSVLIGIVPNRAELISMFDKCVVFGPRDFSIELKEARKDDYFFSGVGAFAYQTRTRGNVALAAAIAKDRNLEKPGRFYSEQLDMLMTLSLEDCDEITLRKIVYAAMLFSSGDLSTLESVGIGATAETLKLAEDCAPWLGMKRGEKSFRFAGGDLLPSRTTREALVEFPGMCRRICAVLSRRGGAARAAQILRAMMRLNMDVTRFAPFAAEYCNVGAQDVAAAVLSAEGADLYAAQVALMEARREGAFVPDQSILEDADESDVLRLRLLDARAKLFAQTFDSEWGHRFCGCVADGVASESEFDNELASHIEGLSSLMALDVRHAIDAYGSDAIGENASLLDVLKAAARRLALRAAGDGWQSDYERDRRIYLHALEELGFEDHARRLELAFDIVDQLLGEGVDEQVVQSFSARLRKGDGCIMAHLVELAGIALDLQCGNHTQAFVRATKLFEACGSPILFGIGLLAHSLQAIAGSCIGEHVEALGYDPGKFVRTAELYTLDRVVCNALHARVGAGERLSDGALRSLASAVEPTPVVMLVIRCAIRSKPHVADAVEAVVPQLWRTQWPASFSRTGSVDVDEKDVGCDDEPRGSVYIEVMGGFRVYRDGRLLADRSWKRQSAQLLVMYLAIARNHAAPRADIGEALWPDTDYYRMRDNMYSALSVARKALGQGGVRSKCIVSTMGKLVLEPGEVSVDKDRLDELCKHVVRRERSDQWVVRNADEAIGLYRGGLTLPPFDPSGKFFSEKMRLDALFADAMLEASKAATRTGLRKEAVRFATEARDVAPGREDCALTLVDALMKDDRATEARKAYEDFTARVIATTSQPPSRRIRKSLEDLLGNGRTNGNPYMSDDPDDRECAG